VSDELEYLLRPAAGEAEGAILLLHGRGTDMYDLAPLLDELDPERRMAGVTAQGLLRLPPGGWHWYIVPRVGFPDPETFHATYERLCAFVDGLPEITGVPLDRTVIGGFSQGCVMAYAVTLGAGRRAAAGTLAWSGFIPSVEGWEPDLEARRGYPVAIRHGSYDPVIPVEFAHEARDLLMAAGLDVDYAESPVAHGIDPRFLPEIREWVAARVADRPVA
jgi:phospholipase/carboxylesterase